MFIQFFRMACPSRLNIESTMIHQRKSNMQVLYVPPITSIFGKLPWPVAPVGDTRTIRGESVGFDGAFCDSNPGEGDKCKWWFINSQA